MSPLWLYGVAAGAPPMPSAPLAPGAFDTAGLAGEPLLAVACGGLAALVCEIAEPPPLARESLAAHDAAVRRLAALFPAFLPARFGETAADEAALRRALVPRAAQLAEALALVEGAVQMTLRVFGERATGDPGPSPSPEEREAPGSSGEMALAPTGDLLDRERQEGSLDGDAVGALGPGARYLAERRRELAAGRALPEVAALRAALRPLLKAERVERHRAGRLLATAYDLVPRSAVAAYEEIVRRETPGLAPYRVAASGPWPPYAFAPEVAP